MSSMMSIFVAFFVDSSDYKIQSNIGIRSNLNHVYQYVGLVTSRAEPSFEHFELGLLIYE